MKKKFYLDLPFGMILLGGGFFMGGLLGFLFAGLIGGAGEVGLTSYFLDYLQAAKEGQTQANFLTVLWGNMKFPLIAFFMGFSFLGTLGLPILFGVEGFVFTFSVSTLCRVLGVSGLIPSFLLFALPSLIWVPILFVLGLQSFYAAILLWGRGRKEDVYPKGYFFRSFLCLLGLFANVTFEYLLLPNLLQAVL
ncbi:MAG: hypothetical protein R3Y63_11545 [Eubacteriales bacterium]